MSFSGDLVMKPVMKPNGSRPEAKSKPSPWEVAASITAGELLTTVLFYPVELVKSRLQASANSFASSSYQYSGLADGLLTILQKNGPQGLFVGIGPVLVRAGSSDFVAAYAGEALLQRFSLPSLGFLQGLFWRTLGCGVSVLSTMPFESVAARVTTSFPPLSSRGAMQVLWKEGGAYSFWRGLRVNLVLCLNPGLTFTALAQIKNLLLSLSRRHGKASPRWKQLSPESWRSCWPFSSHIL